MKYSSKEKSEIVKRYYEGESASAICLNLGIAKSTFYSWIKPHKAVGAKTETGVTPSEFDKIKRHDERLQKVIEVLQKVECTFSAPLKDKLYALEKLHGQYSVQVLCDAMDVPRGTYYNHILRNKKKNTSYQSRRDQLSETIHEIYDEGHQIYGAKKIKAILTERGEFTSERMVAELMQEMNLSSIRTSAKKDYAKLNQGKRKKQDHLKKNFAAGQPNQVWVSDITYFKLQNKFYFICAILDLYSRKVIAYKVSPKQSTQLVTATFKQAFASRRPCGKLIFHSDRGTPYNSNSFRTLLQSLDVEQSFSPSGKPCHNAVMESYFSSMKKEELYRMNYRSLNEFKERVTSYINFYNTERPHSTLLYRTPDAYESLFYKNTIQK